MSERPDATTTRSSAEPVAEALNRIIDKTAAEEGTPGLMRLFDQCFSEWFSHNQPEHSRFPGLLITGDHSHNLQILDTHLAIEKPSTSN